MTATDIIAIYAAFISTVTLIWTIVNVILEKLPRISVQLSCNAKIAFIPGVAVSKPNNILTIKITNKSIFDMYIKKPGIKFREKIDGHDCYYITPLKESVTYPIHIKPREQYSTDIDLGTNVLELLLKCKNQKGKVRIKVTDTTDKNFYSNRISIKHITNLSKMNQN